MDPEARNAPAAPELAAMDKRSNDANGDEPSAKRVKVTGDGANGGDASSNGHEQHAPADAAAKSSERTKGLAPIKAEYLISVVLNGRDRNEPDDDAAEGRTGTDDPVKVGRKGKKGQNQARDFGRSNDALRLCNSRMASDEFSPKDCKFGDRCNMCHDIRKYLAEGRRGDLDTFGGKCPIFEAYGWCNAGWKCRFVKSHMAEVDREDGRKELVLIREDRARGAGGAADAQRDDMDAYGVVNVVASEDKHKMSRNKLELSKSIRYNTWLDKHSKLVKDLHNARVEQRKKDEDLAELRSQFTEPPLRPSEKRRVYFGRETPVLAPLTTQGNLPFRRLCVDLGAQGTYSEMAMAMPLVQGKQGEWALMKAHESETRPPRFSPRPEDPIVKAYDNSKDLKFGAQISASSHVPAAKAAESLSTFLPHLRLIDLNCGCPIDLVYKSGAGSGLLEQPNKIERIVRAMNTVSGEVPITAKLRIGVKEGYATAQKNIERLAFGALDFRAEMGAPGCAAITLHGRTRQQRYKKPADWSYIAECAALVRSYRETGDALDDTAGAPDPRTMAGGSDRMYFLGNGDCFSHMDYYNAIDKSGVDTVMVARGALIKPWIFEEIEKGQYLDKSSTERLGYIERFCRYGMEAWGADEMGIGTTRRFLLEYLSFAHRYVPIGLLEHLPPLINDRPPAYRGRDELETLMISDNYKDWIKISEMFLGPAHEDFKFQPKHKSNSYEMEAEG